MELAMRNDVTLRDEYLLKIWDNYILDNLVESSPCQIAIYDLKSRRAVITSDGFFPLDKEIEHIMEGLKYPDVVYRNGVTVKEHHYSVSLADGRNGIYAQDGLDGCTACQTFTLLILGINNQRVASEVVNEQIMKLGDYFRKLGL